MLAIPPEMLETMSVTIGAVFELTLEGGSLVARPAKPKYSLQQLLAEEQAAGINPAAEHDADWHDAPAMGREAW